ncbi:MAG TPA: hypothetical protein VJ860_06655 [Polyangia bacterium]|jgi:hypothetical protein|nr:hypothetical protein [Polyangia bacterium]
MRAFTIALSSVFILALAACSSSDKKLELGGACSLNSDCANGLLCKFGACHKACVKSVDCAAGERCVQVDGVAVCQFATETACTNGACSTPLTCRVADNTCRGSCATSDDCPRAQTCSANFCLDDKELAPVPGLDGGGIDSAPATPDAAPVTVDLPPATPDAPITTDAPLLAPDAAVVRTDTSAGAETAGETSSPLTCVDKDGDGYGVGAGCRGPDCDDTNTNVWASCGVCLDADGDGFFVGCDRYTTVQGPDCDDTAPFCTNSCVDADKNGTADCAEYWFGETDAGSPMAVFNTRDGNFLIVGRTTQGFGSTDIQLIKLTPTGEVLWKKICGTARDESVAGAVQSADGSILVLVSLGTNGQSWLPLIVKVSEDGVVLASKTVPMAAPGESMDYAATILPSGDFLVAGSVGTQYDSWVGQLAADVMSFQWQTKYTGLGQGAMNTLSRFPDGDLFAARQVFGGKLGNMLKLGPKGELRWARGVPGAPHGAMKPDGNVAVAWMGQGSPLTVLELTPAGDVVWQKSTLGLGVTNPPAGITTDFAGNVLAVALANGTATGATWLTKLSPIGDVLWTYTMGKYAMGAFPDLNDGFLQVSATGIGHMGADPSTSCVLSPQTDTLKPSNVTFTSVTPVVSTMTPWVLADYPLSTMSGTVTWKPICPAATP